MSNPRWNAPAEATQAPLTTETLERMFKAIVAAKYEPPRRPMSRARYRKCMSGDHETLHDICIHCRTDTRKS